MRLPAALWSLLAVPSIALAGMMNAVPVVDSVSVSPSPATANGEAIIICAAHDPDGMVMGMKVTVSGGTLPGGVTSSAVAITAGASVQGQLSWGTPAEGTYTISCTASDNGGLFSGPASATLSTSVVVVAPSGSAPIIDSLLPSSTLVRVGSQLSVTATAHDPEGGALFYAWTTSAGALSGSGPQVSWTAPSAPGAATVTVTVTNEAGLSASSSLTLQVVLSLHEDVLRALFRAPQRVVASAAGDLFVVDGAAKQLWLVTRNGLPKAAPLLPEPPAALALCSGALWVATEPGRLLRLDPVLGRVDGERVLSQRLSTPSGLACDPSSSRLFVAERESNRVRAVEPDGSTAFVLTAAGAAPLIRPIDVAVDAANGLLWVLLESSNGGAVAHAFGLDGQYVRSAVPAGSSTGTVSHAGGLAVGANGALYVSDAFQGVVLSFDGAGAFGGEIGSYGDGEGQLRQPMGLAVIGSDLLVANLDQGRIERFGAGTPLPACAGDSDCDGMPDAWELAYQLSSYDARDALADADGDGLANLEEYLHGTRPDLWDTDGDGASDGDEVHGGFDPLNPNDHHPVLVAGAPVVSDPGWVQLSASVSNGSACSVVWTQLSGPAVDLRGATSLTPGFAGRTAGTYRFQGVAQCGTASSAPAIAQAEIREVSPRPSAGSLVVTSPGKFFLLDGAFSADANGGPLEYQWDQLLGPAAMGTVLSPAVDVRATEPALYAFQLTATDPAGRSATDELPVLVVPAGRQAPTAVAATPAFGTAGSPVTLDASDSVFAAGSAPAFAWSQLAGPAVSLSNPHAAAPSFVPQAPGRYELQVSVSDGVLTSPPQRVAVFVDRGAGLPVAWAPGLLPAVVGEPVALDGTRSAAANAGAPLAYRWRQLSGPAAGLTQATSAVATVVAFEPGVALFELSVVEDGVESLPAVVRVDASAPGRQLPLARASGPPVAEVSQEVLLDGSGSADPDRHALSYAWSQLEGPWTPLDGARSARASFRPMAPGVYVFELRVDDGAVQSAPARVGVLVFPRGGGRP